MPSAIFGKLQGIRAEAKFGASFRPDSFSTSETRTFWTGLPRAARQAAGAPRGTPIDDDQPISAKAFL